MGIWKRLFRSRKTKEVTPSDIIRYRMIAVMESNNLGLEGDQGLAFYLGKIHQLLIENHGLSSEEADEVIRKQL